MEAAVALQVGRLDLVHERLQAGEKDSGAYEAVLKQAVTAAQDQGGATAIGALDPATYEFSTNVDAQRKQIVAQG